jgi:hypothetical protein
MGVSPDFSTRRISQKFSEDGSMSNITRQVFMEGLRNVRMFDAAPGDVVRAAVSCVVRFGSDNISPEKTTRKRRRLLVGARPARASTVMASGGLVGGSQHQN